MAFLPDFALYWMLQCIMGIFLHIEKSAVHVFNVLYWSRSIVCSLWHWNVVWSLALEW